MTSRRTAVPLGWLAFVLIVFSLSFAPVTHASRAPASAGGKSGRLGAGLMVGTINAITGKYILSNSSAVDFGIAFIPSPWTVLYADYLWMFPGLFGSANQFTRQTTGYFGMGGGIGFWSRTRECYRYYCGTAYYDSGTGLFVRAFFGGEWFPSQPPLGVFAEIGPAIGVMPGFGGVIDIGIGVRYYF